MCGDARSKEQGARRWDQGARGSYRSAVCSPVEEIHIGSVKANLSQAARSKEQAGGLIDMVDSPAGPLTLIGLIISTTTCQCISTVTKPLRPLQRKLSHGLFQPCFATVQVFQTRRTESIHGRYQSQMCQKRRE
jgi:hypothetical protein